MKFEEKFPELIGKESYVDDFSLRNYEDCHPSTVCKIFQEKDIEENCLDKQNVSDVLNKWEKSIIINMKQLKKELNI